MKKIIILMSVVLLIVLMGFCFSTKVQGAEEILNSDTTSQMIKLSEDQKDELQDYKEKYGSDTYGFTAFILNKIRIFSIPLCFLGIAVSAIYQYVIGIRKLDVRYKGLGLVVAFITIFVICQVLPLVFALVVKGWRS